MSTKTNLARKVLLSKLAASVESLIKIQESVYMLGLMMLILLSTNFSIKLLKNITVMKSVQNIFQIWTPRVLKTLNSVKRIVPGLTVLE